MADFIKLIKEEIDRLNVITQSDVMINNINKELARLESQKSKLHNKSSLSQGFIGKISKAAGGNLGSNSYNNKKHEEVIKIQDEIAKLTSQKDFILKQRGGEANLSEAIKIAPAKIAFLEELERNKECFSSSKKDPAEALKAILATICEQFKLKDSINTQNMFVENPSANISSKFQSSEDYLSETLNNCIALDKVNKHFAKTIRQFIVAIKDTGTEINVISSDSFLAFINPFGVKIYQELGSPDLSVIPAVVVEKTAEVIPPVVPDDTKKSDTKAPEDKIPSVIKIETGDDVSIENSLVIDMASNNSGLNSKTELETLLSLAIKNVESIQNAYTKAIKDHPEGVGKLADIENLHKNLESANSVVNDLMCKLDELSISGATYYIPNTY